MNEEEGSKKLNTLECIDIHIQQNKMGLINFLRQTTDKIHPVVIYLRDKIFFPSGIPEYLY